MPKDLENKEAHSAASNGLEWDGGSSAASENLKGEEAAAANLNDLQNEETSVDESTDGCHEVTMTVAGTSYEEKPAAKPNAQGRLDYDAKVYEAIAKLGDRSGSSRNDIMKYITATYDVKVGVCKRRVNMALDRGVNKNLTLTRSSGNLYKLATKVRQRRPR